MARVAIRPFVSYIPRMADTRERRTLARQLLEAGMPVGWISRDLYNGDKGLLLKHARDDGMLGYEGAVRMRQALDAVIARMEANRASAGRKSSRDLWMGLHRSMKGELEELAGAMMYPQAAFDTALPPGGGPQEEALQDDGMPGDRVAEDGMQDGRVAGDASKRENDFQMATPGGYAERVARVAEEKLAMAVERMPPPRSWRDLEQADKLLCRLRGIDRGPAVNGKRDRMPVAALLVAAG